MIRDIGEVASKLAKWAVIEAIYLPTLESETPPKQKAIEAGVIQLYCHVLKWVASTLRRPDDKLSKVFCVDALLQIFTELQPRPNFQSLL